MDEIGEKSPEIAAMDGDACYHLGVPDSLTFGTYILVPAMR